MREKGRYLAFPLGPALRRGDLASAGAKDEASDNPDRDLLEDDAEDRHRRKIPPAESLFMVGDYLSSPALQRR